MTESMRERFVSTVETLLDEDERTALVLADISVSSFRAAATRHPRRVVNVGIREQAQIGVAAGFALEGFRPIVHTYAPFLIERPFEQIKLDFGHQNLGAILVSIGASYDSTESGRTHHAPEDVPLMATLPGWEILVPGHPDEVEVFLRRAVTHSDRVYIRLGADSNRAPHPVPPFRSHLVRRGSGRSPTIVAVGPMLDRVIEAAAGIDASIIYTATVRPFDHRMLMSVAESPEIVVVEPYLEGTSVEEISLALEDRPHRLLAIGVPKLEQRKYGTRREHDAANALDPEGIRRRIVRFLETKAVA